MLWRWDGVVTDTVRFKNHVLEGYLQKHVDKAKLFKLAFFPQKFFRICFQTAKMTISNQESDDKPCETIYFRDILECHDHSAQKTSDSRSNSQSKPTRSNSFIRLNLNVSTKNLQSL